MTAQPTVTAAQPTPAGPQYALAAAVTARSIQLAIRARLMRDVAQVWPLLDVKRLGETFPGWLGAMVQLARTYHAQSSAAAASFYRAARAAATASPAPAALVPLAQPPSLEWMTRAFGFAGPGMLARDTARPGTALSTTLGTAARVALEGGRATVAEAVQRDPVAVGWFRLTDGHPCGFCAMLAGRGVVYKHETVEFKSHNDCGCVGAPAFSRDQPLPEVNQRAAQVYTERGPGPALKAFRAAWDEHQAATA